jgi:hypothetical protein
MRRDRTKATRGELGDDLAHLEGNAASGTQREPAVRIAAS